MASTKTSTNIRARVEKSVVVWLLSTLLTGFLAGIGVYSAVQDMAGLSPVPAGLLEDARQRIAGLEADLAQAEAAQAQQAEALRRAYGALTNTRVRVLHAPADADAVAGLAKQLKTYGAVVTVTPYQMGRTPSIYYVRRPGSDRALAAAAQIHTLISARAHLRIAPGDWDPDASVTDVSVWLPPEFSLP